MSIFGKDIKDIETKKKAVRDFFNVFPTEDDIIKKYSHHSMDDIPIGFVYMIRNNKSGRVYIGQTVGGISTSTGTMRRYPKGWIQDHWSNVDVKNDLHEYGWSSFEDIRILALAYSNEELNILEGYYIKKYDSIINGYNTSMPNPPEYRHGKKGYIYSKNGSKDKNGRIGVNQLV